jgi:hypothetical protein
MVYVDSPLNVGFSYTKVLPVPTPLQPVEHPTPMLLESIVPAHHVLVVIL